MAIIIYNQKGKDLEMGWKWWQKTSDDASSQTNNNQPTYETKSFFRSYSSSRSCRPDQDNQNYMICKEVINDGNQTYEKEQRIPINQNDYDASHRQPEQFHVLPQLPDNFENNLRNQWDQFDKAFGQMMTPFMQIPVFFNMGQFPNNQSFSHRMDSSQQQQRHPYEHQQTNYQRRPTQFSNSNPSNNSYYFSHNSEKDQNIKDI